MSIHHRRLWDAESPAGAWHRAALSARGVDESSACHSADYINTQPRGPKFKKDFWQAEVNKMIKVYGAPTDDADVGKIVDYLAATY